MGGGSSLPYDAEVLYLESTGYQWIDTGVIPSRDLSFHCVFSNSGNGAPGYGNVFGARYSSNNNEYQLSQFTNGTVSIGTRNTNLGIRTNEKNDVSFNGSNTVSVNGVDKSINTSNITQSTGTIVLFAIRNGGSVTQMQAGRIYSCSLGSVRDFIPVRVGQTGYMYDRVSGQLFENKGTGSFIIGPDKPNANDIIEVEYLECSGTQYIDTGYIPDSGTGIRVSITRNNSNSGWFVGERNDSMDTRWSIAQDNRYYYGYGTYSTDVTSYNTSAVLDLNYKNNGKFNVWSADGGTLLNSLTLPTLSFVPSYPIGLFKAHGAAFSYGSWLGKVHSFQITQGDAVIMDFKPVRVGGVGYMFDTITDTFYENMGTGDFILGPDKT